MKPKFSFRVRMRRPSNPNNKAESVIAKQHTNAKNEQIETAVKYCLENKVRGTLALKTGNFPLIKNRETINCRLDGKVITG